MALIGGLHFILPLVLIFWTWGRGYASISLWAVQVLVLMTYMAFIFLMGSWVFASFYWRYAVLILALGAAIRSFAVVRDLPWFVAPHWLGWAGYGIGFICFSLLVFLILGSVRAHFYEERPVDLAFPFKNGAYAVFEGGNGRVSSLMNYHYGASQHQGARTNRSMRYAVDITKLTRWGNDAEGFLPLANKKYAVFNQVLYSPCDGLVSDVVDQWPNETPWSGNPPYNVGNHIFITTDDFGVLMGHLQKGSLLVKNGDRVRKGQPIAQAGNSGWTCQPHLHIQAMRVSTGPFWGWEGIPIFFNGKNAVKNKLFFEN
jgi:hypothetical protein